MTSRQLASLKFLQLAPLHLSFCVRGVRLLAAVALLLLPTRSWAQDTSHEPIPPTDSTRETSPPAHPAPAPLGDGDFTRLIEQLGDADYTRRIEASRMLIGAGRRALPYVERGARSRNAEIAARCKDVLAELRAQERGAQRAAPRMPPSPGAADEPRARGAVRKFELRDPEQLRAWHREQVAQIQKMMDELDERMRLQAPRLGRGLFELEELDFDDRGADGHWELHSEVWKDGEKVFEQHEGSSRPAPPRLGVRVETASPALRAQLGLDDESGVVVEHVLDGSAAAEGGVRVFDVITAVNGSKVASALDVRMRMKEIESGSRVRLDVIRRGLPQTIEVEMRESLRAEE